MHHSVSYVPPRRRRASTEFASVGLASVGLASVGLAALFLALGAGTAAAQAPDASKTPAFVAASHRNELPPKLHGLVLLGELGCSACHNLGPRSSLVDHRRSPILTDLGKRRRVEAIRNFLADPHTRRPGTPMPDPLHALPPEARRRTVEDLVHFLTQVNQGPRPAVPRDAAAVARGKTLYHTVGCVACHAPRNEAGEEEPMPGSAPLGDVGARYVGTSLRDFLLRPEDQRPAGRMPKFKLSVNEADDLAQFLRGPTAGIESAFNQDPEQAARGAVAFREHGCAQCHTHAQVPAAPPTAQPLTSQSADAPRGCLTDDPGAGPKFRLTNAQRAAVRAALKDELKLTAEERIQTHLAGRNCVACHERGTFGGIPSHRDKYFTGTLSLGQAGRLPPPLTGVGAKLQARWLADAIGEGQNERPYLGTRMPGFGSAFGTRLAGLLAQTDIRPGAARITPLPKGRKEAGQVRELGQKLAGDQALNCIACHTFAGRKVGTMPAIDLVATTGTRLRPEWFYRYMLAPARFRKGTLMPAFFPDGVAAYKQLADGDTQKQISALWHYLAAGRNVRAPRGLRQPPLHLTVDTEAVLLRRSVQSTGKRGISVGYPGGVNLSFDAESLTLRQVWWGGFLDVAPVWRGQGSGQARPLSRDRAELPTGPGFAILPRPDAAWPRGRDAGAKDPKANHGLPRRAPGQRFRGYDLDAAQRPTFRYEIGAVVVEDKPQEIPGDRPALRRQLRLRGPRAGALWLRAAVGESIAEAEDGFQVGALRISVPATARVVRIEDRDELRIPIPPGDAPVDLELTYSWSPDNNQSPNSKRSPNKKGGK